MVTKLIIGGWVIASVKSNCVTGFHDLVVDEDRNGCDPHIEQLRPEITYEVIN